jgi:hypothetical protein
MLNMIFGRLCHENARMKDLWFEQAKLVKQRNAHVTSSSELQSLTCSALHDLIHREPQYSVLKAAVCLLCGISSLPEWLRIACVRVCIYILTVAL